ncbi:30S ribosomal protein S7 [Candidatus Woesearchaeota archaeon]|nr:30S ribosomal protein S7 [Candidatus Woesearchaeota archaeon]MBW3017902.1 30S ribosomal protein S7 [Candidatus Woesearchaeota archaeon]
MAELKVFNRWETSGIQVQDPGLVRYITLKPVVVPKTGARNTNSRFYKSDLNIVERLVNKLMVTGHKGKKHAITSGHHTGKGHKALEIVEKAFEIIESRTKKNPVEVLVRAIENSAPREEIITIEYGGARYPKAVESAPQRRVDFALRLFTQGAYAKSFNKKKKTFEALADEIIAAYNQSNQSIAVSKKLELERQADSSR